MRWISIILVCGSLSAAQDGLSERIHTAQSSGDYKQAASLYLELIASGTDTPEVRSNCGIMLHLAGRNREALDQFRIALKANPQLAGANLFAGVSEVDLGKPKEALPYLQRARELDQSNPAPDLALGKAYAALRDFQSANQAYAEAAKRGPRIAEAWYGLGITYRSLAEERLRRAVEGESINTVETHRLLDESLHALQRAVALDPQSAQAHLILGESLRDSGKLVDAVPEYQTAIRLAPGMEAAYLGLATSYWKIGQWDDVMPPLRHALVLAPRDPEANAILADMLLRQNDYSTAEKHAEIALAGNPKLFRARVVLARIDLARKQPEQAAAELEKVASADPDGSYHFLLWRAYKLAGKPEEAEAALKEYKRRRAATNKLAPSE